MKENDIPNRETLEALREVEEIKVNSDKRATFKTTKELFEYILNDSEN